MPDYKYDNPDDAYKEAQRRIKKARGGFLKESATKLNLSSLGLTSVPPEIGQLTELVVLFLHNNQLTTIPSEIGQLAKLINLRLYNNQLTIIPSELGQLTNLTKLYLHENQLTTVPPEIGQLTDLTELWIHDNRLTTIPSEISQLTKLTRLWLHDNQLMIIPSEIGRLRRLEKLYLYNNQLVAIPPEIGQLAELTELYLQNNQLAAIPSEISQLTKLQELRIYTNHLTTVPSEIGQLTGLEKLYLHNNRLMLPIPPEITSQYYNAQDTLNYLSEQQKTSNLPIPPEILAQEGNTQAILDYIRENQEASSSPLNEAKLILVGQGGVGKTSLVKRLMHNQFNKTEDQTKGINIEKWSLDVERPSQGIVPITLNIWDFGGQEIMHATHQFFLTKRSLYLLVLDARAGEEEGRVEYWLALINSFAPAAPVLIIINKSDQHHLDINRRGLQKKYPAIAGFVSTSANNGKGIDDLKTAIAAAIATMPDIDSLFPASWMRVKKTLVDMQKANRHFLPYADYKTLCTTNGLEKESGQTTLIRFLHDLGIILNFNDDERVRDTSVLNPNWVTDGIYTLLNNPDLQKAHGLLPRNKLRHILPNKEYPYQTRRFLLDIMLKFELAFELPDRQTLLVPDLISKEQPAINWDDENALQFAYQYSILPRSVLHRFMVRQHHLLDPRIHWRTGAMLQFGNLTALVKADIKASTIRISIIGDGDRRQFLYTLRLTFADIHASISGTKPQEVVPIPAHPDAPPIAYNYLEKLEKMDTAPFPGKDGELLMLNVQQLLNGVSTVAMRQAGVPSRQEIFTNLRNHFGVNDFDGLLFDLDIDPGEFSGEISGQMRSLVRHMEHHGRLGELVDILRKERPHMEL